MVDTSLSSTGAASAAPVVAQGNTPAVTQRNNGKKRKKRSKRMQTLFPYLLVAPAVLYLMMITLYPGVYAIYQSFFRVTFTAWRYTGFENYTDLFTDREFWAALWNTLVMGSIALTIQCVLALTLAFHAYRDPWIKGWRIIFLVPMLFMPSAVAFMFKLFVLDARVFSDILQFIGLIENNLNITSSTWGTRSVLIAADVWQWTPFLFIIFVAALQGQDEEIEEAARLDGASWFQIFWNVSLPMMRPVLAVALVLRGIDITTMFANVFVITKGGPGGATETISYFIYRIGFRTFDFGYASAASVIMLIITVIVAQLVVKRAFRSARD